MSERFFFEAPIESTEVVLTGDDAHHALHVMRHIVGDQIVLFDGSGREFTATIHSIAKHTATLLIGDVREVSRELPGRLEIAVALPKGDRQRLLIEKCVELGVTRLIPLATDRGIAQCSFAFEHA